MKIMNERQVIWATIGIVLILVVAEGIYFTSDSSDSNISTQDVGGSAGSGANYIHHIWVPSSEKRYHQYMNKVVINFKMKLADAGAFNYFRGGKLHVQLKYPDGTTKERDFTISSSNAKAGYWKPRWWIPWDNRYKITVSLPDYFYLSEKGKYKLYVTCTGEINGLYHGRPVYGVQISGSANYYFRVR